MLIHRIRNKWFVGAASLALTVAMAPAIAHQTFLISDLPVLRPGTDNFLILKNGTYFDSGYSITYKMSQDVVVVLGGKKHAVPREEMSDVDSNPTYKQSYIKVVADPEGTGVAGLKAKPDYIALPAEVFANYLHHEGMTDDYAKFNAENKLATIRERYTKHAKSIFQVGKTRSDDWKTPLGFKVEIFPERNPSDVKVGEEFPIRVLKEGRPLANQIIHVGNASTNPGEKADVEAASVYTLRTDADGRASFKITSKDKWYVQLINMEKLTNDEDADYESNWSTVTFAIL
ncbi:MAG: hypothetical protein AMXMBFR37_06880 [Steroidobacteraceae bacterium]|jgi:hypothetical protein